MNRSTFKFQFLCTIIFFYSCALDGPEKFYSPESGFLQVFIKSDDSDSSINILGLDYNVSESDSMDLLVYQGKAYDLDSNYAILYKNINSWRQEEYVYNIMDWQASDGYKSFKIFECHLPPFNYKSLTIGMIASILEVGPYRIPVSLPDGIDGVFSVPVDFTVSENGVTRINLILKPLESMSRYQDSYVFDRKIEVSSVEYLNEELYNEIITISDTLL
jgi:hypothetical protein